MSKHVVRIAAAILFGLAVVGAAQLSVGAGALAGEAVPEHQAAALRGGDCVEVQATICADGPYPDANGNDCRAKTVYEPYPNTKKYGVGTAYCGGSQMYCGVYFQTYKLVCDTTIITIAAGDVP